MKNFNKKMILIGLVLITTFATFALGSASEKTKTSNFAYTMYLSQGGI